jgi:hypothetical protein
MDVPLAVARGGEQLKGELPMSSGGSHVGAQPHADLTCGQIDRLHRLFQRLHIAA